MEANWRTQHGRVIPLTTMTTPHIERAIEHCAYLIAAIDLSAQWPGYGPEIPSERVQKDLDPTRLERMFWVQWLRLFAWELDRRLR